MHRTESDNFISVAGKNQYTDGPPGTTINATDKNTIQEELAYLIETNGLVLKTVATETNTQIYSAIAVQIAANSPNGPVVYFESKNLILDLASVTTVDANIDRISFLNGSFIPTFSNNINQTFDITSDLMGILLKKLVIGTNYGLILRELG